jgi:hypothetical protein
MRHGDAQRGQLVKVNLKQPRAEPVRLNAALGDP